MDKIKSSELGKLKEHPVFKDFPDELKDPKQYKAIEKKLASIMVSDHKHTSPKTFMACKRCKAKYDTRHKALLEYGFKDYHQYLLWRKIMIIINDKQDFQL